jgi:hypothetical protein
MIDIPLTVFLVLLTATFGLALTLDFRRRARRASDRRERDLREAMGKTLSPDLPHERSST